MRLVCRGLIIFGLAFGGLSACGGGGGDVNNNGASFSFLGLYADDAEDCSGTQAVGFSFPLSDAVNPEPGSGGQLFGGSVIGRGGFLNALGGQTFRVQTVAIDYDIPGASVQPPSTVVAAPVILGPGESEVDSSLPEDFNVVPNCALAEFLMVPADVRAFIALNRGSFPETPFTMNVTMTATGQSSAGDVLTSNEVTVGVTVVSDTSIPPTEGTDGSTESGGGTEEGTSGDFIDTVF